MAYSKTLIVNKALTLIGATPITAITDDTNNARNASRVYEAALRSMLAECKWNFATTRCTLSLSSDEMDWDYTNEVYVYTRPTNIVRIFGTNDDNATWREEADYIISDTSGLGIIGTYYLDTPSKFPPFFADALIDKLASEMAYSIVNSASLGEKFKMLYEGESLPKAMSANSQIGVQQYLKDDAWEKAKLGDTTADAARSYG